jgi:hypothetical protein
MTTERRKKWSFRMHSGNSWSWRMVDAAGAETISPIGFSTLAECILDAGRHGYVPWPRGEERRKSDANPTVE